MAYNKMDYDCKLHKVLKFYAACLKILAPDKKVYEIPLKTNLENSEFLDKDARIWLRTKHGQIPLF